MWFFFALAATLGWGLADLFYKKSSDEDDRYSHLRIAVWVGLVMGIAALCLLPLAEHGVGVLRLTNLVCYAPASLAYIISMVIGYAGMRYLEISIISPVQNSSGALSAIAMTLFFAMRGENVREAITDATGFVFDDVSGLALVNNVLLVGGVLLICGGVIFLAVLEHRFAAAEYTLPASERKYKLGALALLFPILYCLFDTVGTAADGIILSEESGLDLGEIDVIVLYGLTFFLAGLAAWVFLLIREKKPYNPLRDVKTKGTAALFEEIGQVFYVYAMAAKPVLAAPMIASYCIVSVILSRIFLKEKLKAGQYAAVAAVIAGIVALGIAEGIGEL